ncbi:MAG: TIGR04372 family glycosyltransferase, partial [Gammaproteobacteria bacterium]|nr:TIGR04372 family glycosyltransferase [Gammaproteobacteria bacterium]
TAHCNFFISTSTGLDSVAQMFKRPVLLTNIALPAELQSWYPHYLFIPKQLKNIHNAHIYKFSEIYSIFLNYKNPLVPVEEGRYLGQVLSDLGLEFIENKAFDILKAVQEMEARLTNTWVENKEQIERQNAFWRTFPHTACQENGREVFGGKIHTKIGSQFLLEHNDLFD